MGIHTYTIAEVITALEGHREHLAIVPSNTIYYLNLYLFLEPVNNMASSKNCEVANLIQLKTNSTIWCFIVVVGVFLREENISCETRL